MTFAEFKSEIENLHIDMVEFCITLEFICNSTETKHLHETVCSMHKLAVLLKRRTSLLFDKIDNRFNPPIQD